MATTKSYFSDCNIKDKRIDMDYKEKVIALLESQELTQEQKEKLEEIFPELRESEDERIRKDIVTYLKSAIANKGYKDKIIESWIAWLERQAEQKSIKEHNVCDFCEEKHWCVSPCPTKLIDEQKPTDFSDLRTWKYIVDAVLTEKEGIGQYLDSPFTEEVAKKLQKRFGKIEQKPAWSEEDKKEVAVLEAYILSRDWSDSHIDRALGIVDELVKKLKSFKDRVQPQPKQEWSEKDEAIKKELISYLAKKKSRETDGYAIWLKSLSPQSHWKPSDEQMKALKDALNDAIWQYDFKGSLIKEEVTRKHAETIESLYNDLKKLK